VQGAGIDEPLLRLTGTTNSPAATQAAYLQDGLGSVIGTTSPTGTLTASQRFDAWGVRTAASGTIPQYGYTGREPDATGMVFYRARYYHPGIGRFASRDPMGMVDAVSPYAYVANNPVNLIDPMGMKARLSGTPMPQDYTGRGKTMLADAGNWLSGVGNATRQTLTDFASGLEVGSTVDQFGRKLAHDFVQNNQGQFGAWGWMANQLAPYAQGYDGSTPSGQLAAAAVVGATLATPGGAAGKAKAAGSAAKGVGKYEVGTYGSLKGRSTPGDGTEIHHAAQKHPAGQAIPGYDPKSGPSIALPRGEHRDIPTMKGEYSGSARDLLAKDIRDLRNNTNAPNSSLRDLIQLNKDMYPGAFGR
jgi:RHS repeat-associated protein